MAAATRKKKKSGSSRNTRRASGPSLPPLPLAEIFAIIVGTGGLFILLALLSYHPDDASWNTVGHDVPARNWMGQVGASLADSLVQLIGIPAVVVPLGLLILAMTLLRRTSQPGAWFKVLAGGALTGFASLLLALFPGEMTLRGGVLKTGGWLGDLCVGELTGHFNTVGTLVIVCAGLLLSLQLTLGIQVGPVLLRLGGFLKSLTVGAARVTGGAVVVGAGAVTEAATSSAASLGQRIRESVEAHRTELNRRREDQALEQELLAAQAPSGPPQLDPPLSAPPASKKGRVKAVQLEVSGVGRTERVDADEDELPLGDARPMISRLPGPSQAELDDDDGMGSLDEALPPETVTSPKASASSTVRQTVVTTSTGQVALGPRIIKSKYLEERGGYGEDSPQGPAGVDFELPSLKFLKSPPPQEGMMSEEELLGSARLLEEKLRDYGVEGTVVEIHPGPVITMYEYAPAPGVKVSKITNLSNDLALALRATAVRIVAPLPGKAAVGIEVPNSARQTVYLREIIEAVEFRSEKLRLPMAIGKDIEGRPYAGDMTRMPHLLVAGSTGAGKSVAVNAMLISLLYARKPEEVRLILVDPKMIEFSVYNDIPHLLMPVVTDPKKAAAALNWAVEEMTRRYQLLTIEGARNIASYNGIMEDRLRSWDPEADHGEEPVPQKLPYIVIVIDELADLMMVAGKEVQDAIVRLAQMARAAGIHLIVATQRPSVDVITGLIKANFPARIAFKVSSKTDSRTILDANGAEYLLGNGDMLHLPPGTASLIRLHGAFVSDEEARVVAEHLRKQGQPRYEESLLASISDEGGGAEEEEEDYDEKYEEAKAIVLETGQASISTIQRRLRIGYNRSARMVERMAKEGLIGPPTQGGKPREIFANKLQASLRM